MTHIWVKDAPLTVQMDRDDQPLTLRWKGGIQRVQRVVESWQIHSDWWESGGAIRRCYYAVITEEGVFCVIYRDLESGAWHLARIYD